MNADSAYITLTDANFQQEVLENRRPILVQVGADWCGPCHIIAPMLEDLLTKLKGRVRFGNLNIDENERVAREFGLHELPILLFFRNGQLVDHIIGTVPKTVIAGKLDELLDAS